MFGEREAYSSESKIQQVKMAKSINTRVSNPKPVTGKPFPGDKQLGIDPDILLYKL